LSSTNEATNVMRDRFSYAHYLEVQQRQQVFSDVALSVGNVFTLTGRGDLEQLTGLHASAALLPALGLDRCSAAISRPMKIDAAASASR
jgi:hypothetical protein